MKSSRGFTLIELLIVIAIIGILMALLFPAVGSAMDGARRAQAKNDAAQIATAIISYDTEYGRLPSTNGTAQQITGDLLSQLMGTNSRKIVFLEVQTGKKGKSGLVNGIYVDPWGKPFMVALDADYDNKIMVSTNGGDTGDTELMKRVGVWNNNTNTRQQARSWD